MGNPKISSSSDLASKSANVKSQPAKGLSDKHLALTGEKKRVEKLLFAPAMRTRRLAPNPNGADANIANPHGAAPNPNGADANIANPHGAAPNPNGAGPNDAGAGVAD